VCDEVHIASNYQPTVSTVCTRSLCMFVFQRLNVGKDTTRDLFLHPAVLEMLLTFTRTAAASSRWEEILTPFPTIMDPSNGNETMGTHNKNIFLLRKIFRQCKYNSDFQSSPTRYSNELQSWIITSNASYVQALPERIPFITGGQHFILIQSSQKHAAAYEKNRIGKKVIYAFHGSSSENWHSILRNGLLSPSINGVPYGSGVYLSPELSVLPLYVRALVVEDSACVADPPSGPHTLSPSKFLCVALCEVIDESIKKSGSIWVQPREDFIMTRYLLVFNNEALPSVNLTDESNISALNALTARLQSAAK
jgi:hypothetical protein